MDRVKLPNGCYLEKAEEDGLYYYGRPDLLVNLITKGTAERLLEPARTAVLEGIKKLEDTTPDHRQFRECEICGWYHPVDFDGDCRDDENRYLRVPEGGELVEDTPEENIPTFGRQLTIFDTPGYPHAT